MQTPNGDEIMGYYVIPTRKQLKKNPNTSRMSWDETYGDWRCKVCQEPMREEDVYYVVGVNPIQVEHVRCSPD